MTPSKKRDSELKHLVCLTLRRLFPRAMKQLDMWQKTGKDYPVLKRNQHS